MGVIDGRPISGLAQDNNDPLSRRDQGFEFVDVTPQTSVKLLERNRDADRERDVYQIFNKSSSVIDTHLLVIAKGLPRDVLLIKSNGTTRGGDPYRRVYLSGGVIKPGQSIIVALDFLRGPKDPRVTYTLDLLSGQGNP